MEHNFGESKQVDDLAFQDPIWLIKEKLFTTGHKTHEIAGFLVLDRT